VSEPHPRIRVIDLETAGNGPHDVCEIGWQDVEQGADGLWRLSDVRGSRLVNPGRPISPETMAVHHILDEHVSAAPFWKTVAPEILRPDGGVLALAAHRAAFEQRYCRPHLTGGAAWICTWKGALRLWPQLPSFSNQRLRYQRRPPGLVHEMGLPAHRALPDAYVTAHHLRDMLNGPRPTNCWRGARSQACCQGSRPAPTAARPSATSCTRHSGRSRGTATPTFATPLTPSCGDGAKRWR
jgi:exodeoxyribonuclease X